jgi:DNA polymerase
VRTGLTVVGHVHDEIIVESDEGSGELDVLETVMRTRVPWAPGLPVNTEGYTARRYRK